MKKVVLYKKIGKYIFEQAWDIKESQIVFIYMKN